MAKEDNLKVKGYQKKIKAIHVEMEEWMKKGNHSLGALQCPDTAMVPPHVSKYIKNQWAKIQKINEEIIMIDKKPSHLTNTKPRRKQCLK